jgi:uncharacterized membrane protein HdeD (DUF308 family)
MDENVLDGLYKENHEIIRRRSLIPIWIKVFIWVFMILGTLCIPVFIFGLSSYNYEIELYGYKTRDPLSTIGLVLFLLLLFKGFVSFSLWFERRWAVTLGIIDAIIGILICTISMASIFFLPGNRGTNGFGLEIVILIPYLIKLFGIKKKWQQLSAD